MREGRLRRLVGGLGLGYLHTAAVIVVGLWLTPFLLHRLGQHEYGLWLLGAQVLVYLALLDVGVVALIPRLVAGAAGRPDCDRSEVLRTLIGQAARVILWQLPAVAIVALVVVWMIPQEWALLRSPLGLVVLAFVVTFPLRLLSAVLQGLQDLAFVGVVQLAGWAGGVAVTVIGIVAGLGLYSLAFGWVVTQVIQAAMCWRRLRTAFRDVVPDRLPSLSFAVVREQFGRGVWISVAQIAQALLGGTDIVVIGKLLGPEMVVPYVCTGKLLTMLANQPQMFMQMALPALSELRTSAPRQRLFEVSRSMTQVTLIASGAIVAVVLAINEPFVAWWVGDARFGGLGLTALLLAGMLLRHVNVTAVYALYCFNKDRRIALTATADGAAGVLLMLVLVPIWGLYGAAVAPIVATCAVSLPQNLRALAREEGVSPVAFLIPLLPWLARLAAVSGAAYVLVSTRGIRGLPNLLVAASCVSIAYAVAMLPLLRRPPLGPMLSERLQPWLTSMPAFARRFASQATR